MIPIVDENDQIVGHKDRADIDHEREIYRVAALWLTNSAGEVLIAQRKLSKDKDPGMWGPAVSGTVEQDETYEVNIYKEAEEEIGLTQVEFKLGPKTRVRIPRNFFSQWFTATVDKLIEEFRIAEEEVEQIKWVSFDDLARDVEDNPGNYVLPMPDIVKLFKN